MPCNLAIAITKAALTDERLKALISEHIDQVTSILANYLRQRHPKLSVVSDQPGSGQLTVGQGLTLSVEQGAVTISGSRTSRTAQYIEDLSTEASNLVKLVADQLFSLEVERTLKSAATILGKQTKDVENAGVVQRAAVYAIQINGLKARIFVLPNARLQIFIDTGAFAQAKTATLQLLQAVQAQGLSLQQLSEVEQHRDDVDHVHVRQALPRGGR